MTWMVVTLRRSVSFILVKHSTWVPFKFIVTFVTDKVDCSGRLPLMESLEMGNEISEVTLMGLIIRVWVCETTTDVIIIVLISCKRGTVTLHLIVVALALHINNNCFPGQTDTVLVGRRISSFPTPAVDNNTNNINLDDHWRLKGLNWN